MLYLLGHHTVLARNERARGVLRRSLCKIPRRGSTDEVRIGQIADIRHWSGVLSYLSSVFHSDSLCPNVRTVAFGEVPSRVNDYLAAILHIAASLFAFLDPPRWQAPLARPRAGPARVGPSVVRSRF